MYYVVFIILYYIISYYIILYYVVFIILYYIILYFTNIILFSMWYIWEYIRKNGTFHMIRIYDIYIYITYLI